MHFLMLFLLNDCVDFQLDIFSTNVERNVDAETTFVKGTSEDN